MRNKGVNVKGKQLMKQPRYFCDLINGGLYQGRQRLQADMLVGKPEVLVYDGELQAGKRRNLERIPDVIFAAGKEEDYLLLMEENQNKTDYGMPLRNMLDVALAYMQQKKELETAHKEARDLKPGEEYMSGLSKYDRLHPVVCITFYHGEKPWDGAESLFGLLRFPEGYEDMKQFCNDFRMNLVHAWNVDPKNFKTGLGTVFELLPFAGKKERLQAYIMEHAQHFSHLSEDECDALEVFIGMQELDKAGRKTYRNPKGEDYNMCTALVEIREEGIEKGIEKGENMLGRLAQMMQADGRQEEFFACCADADRRKALFREYGISAER